MREEGEERQERGEGEERGRKVEEREKREEREERGRKERREEGRQRKERRGRRERREGGPLKTRQEIETYLFERENKDWVSRRLSEE